MSQGKVRGCLGGLLVLMISQLGCWGTLIALVLLAVAISYLLPVVLPIAYDALRILLATGVLFGLAITLRNYVLALYHNIKPEKVTP